MGLIDLIRRKPATTELERDQPVISFSDWADLVTQFGFNGTQYTVPNTAQEQISPLYQQFARMAYKSDSVVFACLQVRQAIFSQARFQWRRLNNGRPGDYFGTVDLAPLETPWPGGTTGDLLSMALLHHDLGGNAFIARKPNGLRLLRPDWVTMLIGSTANEDVTVWDSDAEVVGYKYEPGGKGSPTDPEFFLADEVAHFATIKDPEAQFRGMSILTAPIREIMADKAATDHKLAFFENAATPNLLVKLDVPDLDAFEGYVRKFREQHENVGNAYKTLFTAAGADATVIGANLQQMDFKVTQGAGETRIAAATGVHPVIVGLSEGLAGSSLNAGNFESAMRRLIDITIQPLWQNFAGSLERIMPPPGGARLAVDPRDIPALREDSKKAGERQLSDAQTINTLITAGYEPDSVTLAVTSGDFSALTHTGMTSVQLQKPGQQDPAVDPAPPARDAAELVATLRHMVEVAEQRAALAAAARPTEIHNHMPALEPAQVTVPVTVEPSHLTIEAARAPDVHVTVEPAQVDFAAGAFHVDAPVTVEPSHFTVEAARAPDVNVTVEAAQVTVEPANVTVEAAPTPEVNITVDRLELPEGAVNVTVEPAQVTVAAAPVPEVHVHVPEQRPRAAKVKRDGDTLSVTYDDEETPDGD